MVAPHRGKALHMFGRLPKLLTEIDVGTNLSACVAKTKFLMWSSGFELIGGNPLMHQFVFHGRSSVCEIPGRFHLLFFGLGPRTRIVIAASRRWGLLPLGNTKRCQYNLAQLKELLLKALAGADADRSS